VNATKSAEEISRLTPAEQSNVAFCEGYMSATMDALSVVIATQDLKECQAIPDKPVKEIITVVMQYLKQHPDQATQTGMKVVMAAMAKSCGHS